MLSTMKAPKIRMTFGEHKKEYDGYEQKVRNYQH